MIQIVILGQMELLPRIKRMRNFRDRVNFLNILDPLDFYDTEQLIEHRIRHAGYKGERGLFSREAIRKIYEYTKGYPRQISRICQTALEKLISDGHEIVDARSDCADYCRRTNLGAVWPRIKHLKKNF